MTEDPDVAGSAGTFPASADASSVTTASRAQEADPLARRRMLRMAGRYRRENAVRQAAEIYFELAADHAEAPEGRRAHKELMEIAEAYELAGRRHLARAIYERLL